MNGVTKSTDIKKSTKKNQDFFFEKRIQKTKCYYCQIAETKSKKKKIVATLSLSVASSWKWRQLYDVFFDQLFFLFTATMDNHNGNRHNKYFGGYDFGGNKIFALLGLACFAYFSLVAYRYATSEKQKKKFRNFAIFCNPNYCLTPMNEWMNELLGLEFHICFLSFSVFVWCVSWNNEQANDNDDDDDDKDIAMIDKDVISSSSSSSLNF